MHATLLLILLQTPPSSDCTDLLPLRLRTVLTELYPHYELARRTSEVVEGLEERGRLCRGVAVADFDGDDRLDYAVLLRSKTKPAVRVVAALTRGTRYRIRTLAMWEAEPSEQYVDVIDPGRYDSIVAEVSEQNEVRTVSSITQGVVTGTEESSAVGYFYQRGKWLHVLLSD